MSHLVAKEPWGVIDLDLKTGQIFIQEDWLYEWLLWPGVTTAWTYPQKVATHARIDRQVWGIWSNRAALLVTGTGDVAKKLAGKRLRMNLDVRWDVKPPGHWTVRVWKMPPGAGPTSPHHSHVLPGAKLVELNTADLAPRGAANDAGKSTSKFLTPPHEFGHTIGAPSNYLKDEYVTGHTHLSDTNSLMNVGRAIRARHLDSVVKALNKAAPGAIFRPEPGLL